jgi:DNA invertase Pin-like site-specific DNA recombinase
MNNTKITALYERLSVDDGQTDNSESNSIQNQKLQLEEYAKANGFKNIVHYTDDGESGRFFDRAGYVKMMEDIEGGKVGICITKDVSRIGRDYIKVGLCMETMRLNGVSGVGQRPRHRNTVDYARAGRRTQERASGGTAYP